jgi:hypothetical protein
MSRSRVLEADRSPYFPELHGLRTPPKGSGRCLHSGETSGGLVNIRLPATNAPIGVSTFRLA